MPDYTSYHLIPHRGTLKIVFFNDRQAFEAEKNKIIAPDCRVFWYPEETLGSDADIRYWVDTSTFNDADIIVTNSPLVLRAFGLHKRVYNRLLLFVYLTWKGEPPNRKMTLHSSNVLESLQSILRFTPDGSLRSDTHEDNHS